MTFIELGGFKDLIKEKPKKAEDFGKTKIDLEVLEERGIGKAANLDQKYHDLPCYSASMIKEYIKNPAILSKWKLGENKDRPDSVALKFGTIIHRLVLDDEKSGTYDSILSPAELKVKNKVLEGLLKNKLAMKILKDYKCKEKIYIWEEDLGTEKVFCKAKIDLFTKNGFLIDLKTCGVLEDIKYHIDKYRYDISMAFYKRALEKAGEDVKGVALIAVEKSIPYGCHIFELDEEYLKRGREGGDYKKKHFIGWEKALWEMHLSPRRRFQSEITKLKPGG